MDSQRLVRYLKNLKRHNHRPWFEAHREEYAALRSEFEDLVQQVILRIGAFDAEARGLDPGDCIFRIYRDIRFSKDKTPYKTHFGASLGPGGRKGGHPGYYFHVDAAGMLLVAGGLFRLDSKQLEKIRRSIHRSPRLQALVAAKKFRKHFDGLSKENQLQSAPRGYPKEHPRMELLKLKNFIAWNERPVSSRALQNPAAEVAESCKALHPLVVYLRAAVE